MTVEQALKIEQTWTPIQARNDLERLLLTGERPADKVIALGCKAFEKQTPKKPKVHKVSDKSNDYYAVDCPECQSNIFCTFGLGRTPDEKTWNDTQRSHKFCKNCGQALDWSDTE